MSTASAVPAITDYLVAQCTASQLLGAAPQQVTVVDGPPISQDVFDGQRVLFVGYDLLAESQDSAEGAESWPVLNFARTQDEDGHVACTAQAWTGDKAMKTARDMCAAILGAVVGLLRGMPAQGGPGDTTMGGLCFWSAVSATAWSQKQTTDGAVVACSFSVMFRARQTG